MDMQLEQSATNAIESYDADSLQIKNQGYSHNIIVTADQIILYDFPADASKLSIANCEPLLSLRPQVCILGTGKIQQQISIELIAHFAGCGIGLEIMNNPAAYRTFNILLAEDRHVALAVLPNFQH